MSKKKFTIPTLADIKETNKIRSKSDPALFKSGSKASSVEAESTQLAFKPSVAGTQLHHDPDITVKKPRDHYQSGATKHSPSSGNGVLKNHTRSVLFTNYYTFVMYYNYIWRCLGHPYLYLSL